jgi:HD-like signal output (HDOD) protein
MSALAQLVPINSLSQAAREKLARTARVAELGKGDKLLRESEGNWLTYLVRGELRLASSGKLVETIAGGSARSLQPVFGSERAEELALANSNSKLIRFERELYEQLLEAERAPTYEVVDVEITGAESTVFHEVYSAYSRGALKLPTMPEVAVHLRKITEDPDVGIPDVVKAVQMDPVVAGKLIHVATSPLFRGATPVKTIKDAVVRLGLKTTCSLAVSLALRDVYRAKSTVLRDRSREVWEHTLQISALSYILARKCTPLDAERALLAGLVHDVGVLPILAHAHETELTDNAQELEDAIENLRGPVGVMVVNSWELDADFANLVTDAEDWGRDASEKADYCDLVVAAHLLSLVSQTGQQVAENVPALRKLGLTEDGEATVAQFLQDGEEEIRIVKQLLSG